MGIEESTLVDVERTNPEVESITIRLTKDDALRLATLTGATVGTGNIFILLHSAGVPSRFDTVKKDGREVYLNPYNYEPGAVKKRT